MSASAPFSADRALKTLSRALVEAVGGLDAAAACTRVQRSSLASYYAPNLPAFMPVDVVGRLEEVAEQPLLTAELARRAGYELVPVRPIGRGELAALIARLGAEVAETFATYATAMADGRLTAEERATLAREVADIKRAADAVLGALRAEDSAA